LVHTSRPILLRAGWSSVSVFIRNGADGGDVVRKWLTTRYRTPLDNMEQPLYFDTAVRAAGVEFLVGYSVALQQQRPAWNKGDFFGDMFAKKRNNADKTNP